MEIFQSLFAVRLAFIMGITNGILALLLFFSCRCPVTNFGKKWMASGSFQKFYKFHCYFWWIFLASVVIHIVFSIGLYGIPF